MKEINIQIICNHKFTNDISDHVNSTLPLNPSSSIYLLEGPLTGIEFKLEFNSATYELTLSTTSYNSVSLYIVKHRLGIKNIIEY